MRKKESPDFDARLERLEALADRMRSNELPLEEAYAIFEEGVKLAKGLGKELTRMESRVEALLNDPDGPDDVPEIGLFDQE